MATFRIRPGLRKSAPKPNSSRSLAVRRGARWRGRRTTISCCLSRRCSAITARTPPRPHSVAVMTTQSKQGEQEVLQARDCVGQTSGATPRGLNPGFSEKIGNSRRTGMVPPAAVTPAMPRPRADPMRHGRDAVLLQQRAQPLLVERPAAAAGTHEPASVAERRDMAGTHPNVARVSRALPRVRAGI